MTASQLEPVRVHPRRRPALDTALPALMIESPSGSSKMRLRKGETFNTPTTPSTDRDPVLNIRSLPRRSPTSLEASEQRMTSILERLTLESPEDQRQDLPFPTADSFSASRTPMDARVESESPSRLDKNEAGHDLFSRFKKSRVSHSHGSDSGLGSSVSSDADSDTDESKVNEDLQLAESAITSDLAFEPASSRRQLHLGACKQIERYILVPILKESKLKSFHTLAQSVPKRIVNRQIVDLRDLEKTLLWLAPKATSSHNAYLHFCEFTIQCLHTTVSHLNVRDQRLPSDRPYTNGYFLDLVSQVRRYAAMMQASRERVQETPGCKTNQADRDLMPPPEISLEGGLSKNGRPVELVVTQGSTSTSMATGQPYDPESPPVFKRTMSLDDADEGVQRSMARRKKNAPPMDINQKCDHCDKVFKRPCDLTKHEKTHSRPWKCSESTCKYAQIGWPTEKERDRHVNDKHSDTPNLYKCQFQPCTYASKRESNCKQHMEKAHGWLYVRSKNNARGGSSKSGSSLQATPGTPRLASTPASKSADVATPNSGPSPSPSNDSMFANPNFNFNDPPAPARSEDFPSLFETSDYTGSSTGVNNDLTSFPTSVNLDAFQAQFEAGDPNGLIPALQMHRQSMDSMSVPSANSVPDLMGASMSFDGSPMAPTDTSLNFDWEWSNLDMPSMQNDQTAMNMQFATPGISGGNNGLTSYSARHAMNASQNYLGYGATGKVSGLSPNAQGNLMLYSPASGAVEGHLRNPCEYDGQAHTGNDFTLYDQFTRMRAPTMAPTATQLVSGDQYGQSNQMFPPINGDVMFQGIQSWGEHCQQGAHSDNGLASDMDLEFMNMK